MSNSATLEFTAPLGEDVVKTNISQLETAVLQLSYERKEFYTVVDRSANTAADLISALTNEASGSSVHLDYRIQSNNRRIELIEKEIDSGLSRSECKELKDLTKYIDRIYASADKAGLRAVRGQLWRWLGLRK